MIQSLTPIPSRTKRALMSRLAAIDILLSSYGSDSTHYDSLQPLERERQRIKIKIQKLEEFQLEAYK